MPLKVFEENLILIRTRFLYFLLLGFQHKKEKSIQKEIEKRSPDISYTPLLRPAHFHDLKNYIFLEF